MNRMAPIEQIEDLKEISETVDNYIALELYRESGDDLDIGTILASCYNIVFEELEVLGIGFNLDKSDLVEDFYLAKHMLYIRKFVSMDYLKELLTSQVNYDIADDLVNNDEIEDELFDLLFTKITEENPSSFVHSDILDISNILDMVYSNEKFKAHLISILVELKDVSTYISDDKIGLISSYIQKIKEGRQKAMDATYYILDMPELLGGLDMKKIDFLLRNYDLDKISADNVAIYSVIDSPDYMGNEKSKYLDMHHKRSPHHLEYWMDRDENPSTENLILLIAHHADDLRSFTENANDMVSIGGTKGIFSKDQVDLMQKMIVAIGSK